MPFADFYPFSSFLDAVEIHIREKAAEANGGSRPVVTKGQEHRRSMFEPAVVAFLTSLRDEGRLGATGPVGGRNVWQATGLKHFVSGQPASARLPPPLKGNTHLTHVHDPP